MRKVCLLLIFVLFALCTACSGKSGEVPDEDAFVEDIVLSKTYSNLAEGVTFSYPDTWGLVDSNDAIVMVTDTGDLNYNAKMAVARHGNFELTEASKSEYQEHYEQLLDNFSVKEFGYIYLDGQLSRKATSSYKDKGDVVVETQYFCNTYHGMYIISFSTFEKSFSRFEPVFDAIIASYNTMWSRDEGALPSGNSSFIASQSPNEIYAAILSAFQSGVDEEGGGITSAKYVFYDIDANGVQELIIDYEIGWEYITLIYTWVDGAVYKIGEFWSRRWIEAIDDTGMIYVMGSNGWASSSQETLRISDDKKSLTTIESWDVDYDNNIYTRTSHGETEIITEQEYNNYFYDVYNWDIFWMLEWLPAYSNPASDALNNNYSQSQSPSNDFVSADGYTISSGDTVYRSLSGVALKGFVRSIGSDGTINVAWTSTVHVLYGETPIYEESTMWGTKYYYTAYSSFWPEGSRLMEVSLSFSFKANQLYRNMP